MIASVRPALSRSLPFRSALSPFSNSLDYDDYSECLVEDHPMIGVVISALAIQSASPEWEASRPALDWTLVSAGTSSLGFMKTGPSPSLFWLRSEMRDPNQSGNMSQVSLAEFDCVGGRSRPIQFTSYTGPNMTGTTQGSVSGVGDWRYPTPGSVGETQFRWACSR